MGAKDWAVGVGGIEDGNVGVGENLIYDNVRLDVGILAEINAFSKHDTNGWEGISWLNSVDNIWQFVRGTAEKTGGKGGNTDNVWNSDGSDGKLFWEFCGKNFLSFWFERLCCAEIFKIFLVLWELLRGFCDSVVKCKYK